VTHDSATRKPLTIDERVLEIMAEWNKRPIPKLMHCPHCELEVEAYPGWICPNCCAARLEEGDDARG
jgi:hypothetical protein